VRVQVSPGNGQGAASRSYRRSPAEARIGSVGDPDAQAYTATTLEIASHGNLTTETLRAFTEEEMVQILQKMG